jgi:hypothetical protein
MMAWSTCWLPAFVITISRRMATGTVDAGCPPAAGWKRYADPESDARRESFW